MVTVGLSAVGTAAAAFLRHGLSRFWNETAARNGCCRTSCRVRDFICRFLLLSCCMLPLCVCVFVYVCPHWLLVLMEPYGVSV